MVIRFEDRAERRRRAPGGTFGGAWLASELPHYSRVTHLSPSYARTISFIGERGPAVLAAALFSVKADPSVKPLAVVSGSREGPDRIIPSHLAAELAIDLSAITPIRMSDEVLLVSHEVIVLGSRTVVAVPPGIRVSQERWPLDEPHDRGIGGVDRLRLIRDGIELRVNTLIEDLGVALGR